MPLSQTKKNLTRRRESAQARKEVYEARTIEEQLALIETRRGASQKERKRLEKRLKNV
jgi:hypothetical protein